MLRLDGKEYPLRAPEALPVGDAFGWAICSVGVGKHGADARPTGPCGRSWRSSRPELPVALGPRQALTLVAFYSVHLTDAVVRLRTPAGDPVPFSTPARASSRRRKSRRASASDSERSSPCP